MQTRRTGGPRVRHRIAVEAAVAVIVAAVPTGSAWRSRAWA